MTFTELGINPNLLKAVEKEGYKTPTDIQRLAIPFLFKGRDVLASAQTGTGKTAAFGIPAIQLIETSRGLATDKQRKVKVLILAPTRELAGQIQENMFTLGRFSNIRVGAFYGGVPKGGQIRLLQQGVDIVVGTPGRILDLIQGKFLQLQTVQMLVLDEADQMLDMGFLPDVKTIISHTPTKRLSSLFSATMPQPIIALSHIFLINPERIAVTPVEQPIDKIVQKSVKVEKNQKLSYLIHLLKDPSITSALVFTRTKRGAKRTALNLNAQGLKTTELHGNQSQVKRSSALKSFKEKNVRILVATDIASRGIDIHQLSHVINFDMPETPEAFLHRTGRTGRAGFSGTVVNLVSREEQTLLKAINRHTGLSLFPVTDPTFVFDTKLVVKVGDDDNDDRFQHRRPQFPKKTFHQGKSFATPPPAGRPSSQGPSQGQRPRSNRDGAKKPGSKFYQDRPWRSKKPSY